MCIESSGALCGGGLTSNKILRNFVPREKWQVEDIQPAHVHSATFLWKEMKMSVLLPPTQIGNIAEQSWRKCDYTV